MEKDVTAREAKKKRTMTESSGSETECKLYLFKIIQKIFFPTNRLSICFIHVKMSTLKKKPSMSI